MILNLIVMVDFLEPLSGVVAPGNRGFTKRHSQVDTIEWSVTFRLIHEPLTGPGVQVIGEGIYVNMSIQRHIHDPVSSRFERQS